jgi:hypothetical protein
MNEFHSAKDRCSGSELRAASQSGAKSLKR